MEHGGRQLSDPSSSSSSSLKRLLSDLKPPRQKNPLNHSPPSDRHKNPRHLPNLSDCHACRRHVTDTNPKHRLQTLDSLWRIVLLCKHCMVRVRDGESCSYCFSPTDESDSHRCRNCRCRVHRDCAVRYSSSAPWSYSKLECTELGFTVCIDCWVPKLLAVSNKVCYRNKRNGLDLELQSEGGIRALGRGGKSELVDRVYNSTIENGLDLTLRAKGELGGLVSDAKSAVESRVYKKMMKNGLGLKLQPEAEIRGSRRTAKPAMETKNMMVTKAKEKALKKEMMSKRALEFADGAIKLAKKKGESEKECLGASDGNGSYDGGDVVFDDAELAVRLHRAMNSSPRISRRLSLGNYSDLAVQSVGVDNGVSSVRPSELKGGFSFTYKRRWTSKSKFIGPRDDVCTDAKLSENLNTTHSEPSVCGTPPEGDDVKHKLLVYRRKCKKCGECEEKGETIRRNDSKVFENLAWHVQNVLVYKRKCKNGNERQVKDEVIPENSMRFEDHVSHKQDVLVYRRKCKKEDEYLEIGEETAEDRMNLESRSCHTRDELVYRQKFKKSNECRVEGEVIPGDNIGFEDRVHHKQNVLVYKRKCKREDECLEIGGEFPVNSMLIENQSFPKEDELECKLNVDGDRSQFHLECNGIRNKELDSLGSYVLKYRKRDVRSGENANSLNMILGEGSCAENYHQSHGASSRKR